MGRFVQNNNYQQNQNYQGGNTAPVEQKKKNDLESFKAYAARPGIKARFEEVLGNKAPQFVASVISAVNTNPALQKAEPASVMGAAMIAASLNLSVVKTLGQAAIVPYNETKWSPETRQKETRNLAQFQIMVRGIVQLALRSGQYQSLNADVVYEDEYLGESIKTGDVELKTVRGGMRDKGDFDRIIGYFAYFRTTTGFEKTVYWSKERVMAHALRYTQSKKLNEQTGEYYLTGAWQTNFDAMARKTVLKTAINNYGPMSVDSMLAQAITKDQVVVHADGSESYDDNPENDFIVTGNDDGALPPPAEETPVNAQTSENGEITPPTANSAPQPKESAPEQTTAPEVDDDENF